jgi:hypothetical protein
MKILPVGAEFFHVEKLPDMAKLIITFHRFSELSKKRKK